MGSKNNYKPELPDNHAAVFVAHVSDHVKVG